MKLLGLVSIIALMSVGFFAGRLTASQVTTKPEQPVLQEHQNIHSQAIYIQNNDPRELQPLPAPGEGQIPGLPQGSEECPLYFFQDGEFFEMQPGQGPPGQGGGSPELFPLEPVPRPGQPAPQQLPQQFSSLETTLAVHRP